MKVKINSWNAIATWVWDIDTESNCTICQLPFESPCPKCKVPGDECVPSIFFFFFFLSFKKKKKKTFIFIVLLDGPKKGHQTFVRYAERNGLLNDKEKYKNINYCLLK